MDATLPPAAPAAPAHDDAHDGPFVVLRCETGVHARRVVRSKAAACPGCVLEPVHCPSGDTTLDEGGEWVEVSSFFEFALLVMQRWLRASSPAAPTFSPFVSLDNAAEVRAQLFRTRACFGEDAPEHGALTELFHAAAALDTFETARRRGLLDEVYLRGGRAVAIARKHSPEAHDIERVWRWAQGGWQ